jgi:RsiW-degrading membrane proteinase PrsW (M82 family)
MTVSMAPDLATREKNMRVLGGLLWLLGVLGGATLLVLGMLLPPLLGKDPMGEYMNMAVAVALALPACFVYVWVPLLIDRYDPEPLWALTVALLWGALASAGFALLFNTLNASLALELGGEEVAKFVGPVVSAPLVEEGLKGLGVLGVYLFLRREFDGVVDGVIYATFIALGFAATENIIYYTRFAEHGVVGLTYGFIVRGILSPWLHPLFTSMTGIGVGIARETTKSWIKIAAPIAGYGAAVTLHAIWNGTSWLGSELDFEPLIALVVWLPLVAVFGGVLIALVAREGRIIRKYLEDEVLLGYLRPQELALVTSPIGRLKALLGTGGFTARKFVDVASRLALTKWHTAVAMRGQKRTLSIDFVAPLRQELFALRAQLRW